MALLCERLYALKGELVKIGATTGFFYIHRVDKDTERIINIINDAYDANYRRLIECYTETYDNAEATLENRIKLAQVARDNKWKVYRDGKFLRDMAPERVKDCKKLLAMTHEDKLIEISRVRSNARRKKNTFEEHLKNCPRILGRQVIDEYPTIPEIDRGTILIVEGIEEGAFWFESEFAKALRNNNFALRLFDGEMNKSNNIYTVNLKTEL